MSEAELPAHVVANRAYWDEQAPHYVANGEASWATDAPRWGLWGIPEATTTYPWMSLEWARRWPSEEAWKARKGDR
jgi:hypothetical protein